MDSFGEKPNEQVFQYLRRYVTRDYGLIERTSKRSRKVSSTKGLDKHGTKRVHTTLRIRIALRAHTHASLVNETTIVSDSKRLNFPSRR